MKSIQFVLVLAAIAVASPMQAWPSGGSGTSGHGKGHHAKTVHPKHQHIAKIGAQNSKATK